MHNEGLCGGRPLRRDARTPANQARSQQAVTSFGRDSDDRHTIRCIVHVASIEYGAQLRRAMAGPRRKS